MYKNINKIKPGPGQESVWDYPRPPKLESVAKRLRVMYKGHTIADTTQGFRILETSHPPTYYFPPDNVDSQYLKPNSRNTFCEWKGSAKYYDVTVDGQTFESNAWYYNKPDSYPAIKNYVSFYSGPFECFVDDEPVQKQAGDYYGGWITRDIVGPFKGEPGTWGW